VHGRKFWRKAISNNAEQVDKVIFLGDYIDPYEDEIEENPDLMDCTDFYDSAGLLETLNDIIGLKKNEPNKYILLTGNHTDSYIWSKFRAASRTDYKNWEKYHKFFSQNLNLFNLVWVEKNVIFSHAGLTKGWTERVCSKNDLEFKSILHTAKIIQNIPVEEIHNNNLMVSLLGEIPRQRNGDFLYGSCEWADIAEHLDINRSSINNVVAYGEEGTFQVFGHTQLKKALITDKWACLDCRKAFIFDTETYACSSCL
jgi:hypothetical protein